MTGNHEEASGFADLQSASPNMLQAFANQHLSRWRFGAEARTKLINVSENATFIVSDSSDDKSVLRLHRRDYHSEQGILSELAWMKSLKEDGALDTPEPLSGVDGNFVQTVDASDGQGPWRFVLFEFLPGAAPDESGDLAVPFEQLGEITARSHNHSQSWERPHWFERPEWNEQALLGSQGIWGDWRSAPNISSSNMKTLELAEHRIRQRLTVFGKSRDRYGLVHADMRLANLLVDRGRTQLIDFDDCGISWFLYDFASAVSFLELHPEIQNMTDAWLRGYTRVRAISDVEKSEIMTFVMLRRLALLAWIGSHKDTELAKEFAPNFASDSARLAVSYLGLERL